MFHPFLKLAQFALKPREFFFVFLPFQLWLETAIVFFPCHTVLLQLSFSRYSESPVTHLVSCPDYFVAAIDLRKSATLYTKNASPIPPTIAKLRHTASSPPPR